MKIPLFTPEVHRDLNYEHLLIAKQCQCEIRSLGAEERVTINLITAGFLMDPQCAGIATAQAPEFFLCWSLGFNLLIDSSYYVPAIVL